MSSSSNSPASAPPGDAASQPTVAPPAVPVTPASPLRTCLALLTPMLGVLLLMGLLLAGAIGFVRWTLLNENGSRWLLQRLPMVQVQGFSGALLGPQWRADSLRVQWDSGQQWLLIEGLQADGLQWTWRPSAAAWAGVQAQSLVARKVLLHTGPAGKKPTALPADFAPPLQVAVQQTRAAEFVIDGLEPWRQVEIDRFTMDPSPRGPVQAERLQFQAFGLVIDGTARIGHEAPLPLQARATLRPLLDGDAPRWAAVLQASGSLEQLLLNGTLRGVPVSASPASAASPVVTSSAKPPLPAAASIKPATKPRRAEPAAALEAPALDLQATLQPLQAWVLAGLKLQTQSLDLAALWAKAPHTRLSGAAELNGGAKSSPLTASVNLVNALPGRWDEGRLPVARMQVQARGELARRDRLDVQRFDVTLADGSISKDANAGRWSGSALWQGHELTLDTRLQAVTPQRLDNRAAAMTLTGPVALTLRGIPSPDFQASEADKAASPPQSLRWKIDLQGQLAAAPQPVQLLLEGELDDNRLAFTQMRAKSGSASAELQAALTRDGLRTAQGVGNGGWKLATTGTVQNFDPVVWLPGEVGGTWRKGPHRLSGDWQLDTRLPPNPDRLAGVELLQRLAGNGKLAIRDSVLAGVPLSVDLNLGYTPSPTALVGTLRAEMTLGGNQVLVEGRGDPGGSGASDRWRVEVKADTLSSWAPLAKLDPALADWVPRSGSVNAELAAQGRWPALQSEGKARITQLQVGTLTLARGSANWRMDIRGAVAGETRSNPSAQPISLQLDLAGAQMGKQRADNLRADIQGTLAEHRIDVTGALPLVPPPVAEQVLGIQAQSGTRLQLQAQGAWRPETAGGGRWQARIARLMVGSWDGSAEATASASSWAEARDLRAELRFNTQGELASLQADAGSLRLADAATLKWDAVRVDLLSEVPGTPPQIQLRADIEPFALAPLLARAQPKAGWQGDLRLAARLDIRAGERVDADLIFERRDGDLHLSSGEGLQLMGLTDFRLALSAHDGVWNFTPLLRGRSLGEVSGNLRVQTTADRRWPQPEAPISGEVLLRVADVGIWSSWVPPGWRLAGEVQASAALSGRFGEPQYTGSITGSGLGVRNLLEGVNVSDGQVAVKLSGDTAQVERFTLKGGEGLITLTGGATFGTAPQARLQLQAERFRVLGRVDRQLTASGRAELTLNREQVRLDGKLKVDDGLFDTTRSDAPSLDDDVAVRRPGAREAGPVVAEAPKARRDVVLDLDVDLGEKIRVRGRGLDTSLRGAVRMTAPSGRLAVNGTISTEAGTYAAYGQKLVIERGLIAFSGSADNPRLDVLALRPNIDTRVGVAITGNLLTLRVRLFSEPDMSDTDKLAWLVLGRAPDGLGRNDTALLQRAAVALLSGEGEAPTDALLRNLGIDELSLRQGDTDVRETVITLGKQLSRRWYLGYERGVNATTGTWQLIYRIAQRFTLRAQSGLDNSLDIIWTLRTQETPADAATRKATIVPSR